MSNAEDWAKSFLNNLFQIPHIIKKISIFLEQMAKKPDKNDKREIEWNR